jgi:2'-5' RNA ligase
VARVETVRAFVAVELAPEVRRRVAEAIEELRGVGAEIGWVRPDNLHLTLRFLGEREPAKVDAVRAGIADRLRGVSPIRMSVEGVGRFPDRGTFVRVLWVGCGGELDRLRDVWERVQAAARAAGLPRDDHGFSPHVTIGRVKSKKNVRALLERLDGLAGRRFGEQTADSVVLMQSRLEPGGAVYTALERWPLK